jgi:hypothetical protein
MHGEGLHARRRTEELLCRDEQVGDGLFYLRKLLLGLHFLTSQCLRFGVGAECGRPTYIFGRTSRGPLRRAYRAGLFCHVGGEQSCRSAATG